MAELSGLDMILSQPLDATETRRKSPSRYAGLAIEEVSHLEALRTACRNIRNDRPRIEAAARCGFELFSAATDYFSRRLPAA
jgi:hypothetical protein